MQRGAKRVGFLDERLSQDNFECLTGECSIGNVAADAFVDVRRPAPRAVDRWPFE